MDKPFVIRYSEEDENDQKTKIEDYMVDQVVSYFTKPDPEGHRKRWNRRKKVKKTHIVDYYYV